MNDLNVYAVEIEKTRKILDRLSSQIDRLSVNATTEKEIESIDLRRNEYDSTCQQYDSLLEDFEIKIRRFILNTYQNEIEAKGKTLEKMSEQINDLTKKASTEEEMNFVEFKRKIYNLLNDDFEKLKTKILMGSDTKL